MSEWQPIETAPKTGAPIWLGSTEFSCMRVAFWKDGKEYEHHGSVDGGWRDWFSYEGARDGRDLQFTPTHWMPLPEPPKQITGQPLSAQDRVA